jgi:endonuclease/exonuclease/phosphatase family metal-dependent hydrolase
MEYKHVELPMKLVTWNIEKAKRWPLLERCLEHESIRTADILCLNEVDDGMARSGNLRIGHEIGGRLGMEVVFGPTFKELTKGMGDELLAPGENTTAMQGNAVLSRLPVLDWRNLQLPNCFDHSTRAERREGNRHVLIVRLDCGAGRVLTVANAHLEVFGTAQCRSVQTRFILDQLQTSPAVVTGDFNTNTFSRGSTFHIAQSLALLAFSNAQARVREPWRYEALFRDMSAAGFSAVGFNDSQPTCSVDLRSLDDRVRAPSFVRKFILSRCSYLPLRLDFFFCRGLRAVSPGRTITELPCQPSDHLPITCEVTF